MLEIADIIVAAVDDINLKATTMTDGANACSSVLIGSDTSPTVEKGEEHESTSELGDPHKTSHEGNKEGHAVLRPAEILELSGVLAIVLLIIMSVEVITATDLGYGGEDLGVEGIHTHEKEAISKIV